MIVKSALIDLSAGEDDGDLVLLVMVLVRTCVVSDRYAAEIEDRAKSRPARCLIAPPACRRQGLRSPAW